MFIFSNIFPIFKFNPLKFYFSMDIKTVSLSQIENTYVKYERPLREIIQINAFVPDHLIKSNIDYLSVLWILVTEDQKLYMYDMIRLKFTSFLGDLTISNVSYAGT